jgi:hypothetical protein
VISGFQLKEPSFTLSASAGRPDQFDTLLKNCSAKVSGDASTSIPGVELTATPTSLTPYEEGQRWTIPYLGQCVANP